MKTGQTQVGNQRYTRTCRDTQKPSNWKQREQGLRRMVERHKWWSLKGWLNTDEALGRRLETTPAVGLCRLMLFGFGQWRRRLWCEHGVREERCWSAQEQTWEQTLGHGNRQDIWRVYLTSSSCSLGGSMLPRSICGQFVLWETVGNIFQDFNMCTAFWFAFGKRTSW